MIHSSWVYCINMQCCGSVIFWYGSGCGSGSSDPYLWLADPKVDLVGPKTYWSNGPRSGYLSRTLVHLHHSSEIKSHKTEELKVFLIIFAWWFGDPVGKMLFDRLHWNCYDRFKRSVTNWDKTRKPHHRLDKLPKGLSNSCKRRYETW